MLFRRLLLVPLVLMGLYGALSAGEAPTPTGPPPIPTNRFQPELDRFLEGGPVAEGNLRFALGKATPKELVDLLHHLVRLGNHRLSPIASPYLDHPDQDVLIAAIGAVGRLGIDKPETVDHLARHLNHPLPLIRDYALTAVADLHDDRCLPRLIPLLDAAEPALAKKSLAILQDQTGQKLPADRQAWQRWYEGLSGAEGARYDRCIQELASRDVRRMVEAIHGLGSLVTLRNRALAAMAPLARHADPSVRLTVEAYLHQLTRVPADQPLSACLERIAITVPAAAAPPEPPHLAALALPKGPPRVPGFLDTWKGLFTIIAALCFALTATVFFLRTPAGQAVKSATQRFARKTGAVKVVVMIEEGTRRLVKPLAKPIKQITRRIANDSNRALRQVELGTRRLARSATKRISASSDEHAALERKKTTA